MCTKPTFNDINFASDRTDEIKSAELTQYTQIGTLNEIQAHLNFILKKLVKISPISISNILRFRFHFHNFGDEFMKIGNILQSKIEIESISSKADRMKRANKYISILSPKFEKII